MSSFGEGMVVVRRNERRSPSRLNAKEGALSPAMAELLGLAGTASAAAKRAPHHLHTWTYCSIQKTFAGTAAAKPAAAPDSDHVLVTDAAALDSALATLDDTLTKASGMLARKATIKAAVQTARTQLASVRPRASAVLSNARDAASALAHNAALSATCAERGAALDAATERMAGLVAAMRGMLTRTAADALSVRERRDAAGGRFNKADAEEVAVQLGEAVDGLIDENKTLWETNAVVERAKADLAKRLKEMGERARNESELHAREASLLKASLKKAESELVAAQGAAKDASKGAKRATEAKELNRRLELAKSETEQAKAQLKGLKASLEAAHAAHAKSKDASKSAHSKAADARAARAAALRDLEQAQLECSALATELCALHPSGGRLPEGATAKFGAPWPRTAFSLRGGHVLHARACGDQDVSRCVTTHYEDHAQLEAYLQQQDGMVLCHACRADPGF